MAETIPDRPTIRAGCEACISMARENERLCSVLHTILHTIGAMVHMDRHGNIRFKPDYSPEDMLNAVNAALEE